MRAEFKPQTLWRGSGQAAVVLALRGDLGAGKTTFLQGFAKGLGIKENVLSPTFIVMKKFEIPAAAAARPSLRTERSNLFKFFYHFDLYRLENEKDVEFLEFEKIISNQENIIAIEWPEKIKNILPENIITIRFNNLEENKREIVFM